METTAPPLYQLGLTADPAATEHPHGSLSPVHNDLVYALLSLAAAGQLYGTWTVWLNYLRGARVGEKLRADVHSEEEELEQLGVLGRAMRDLEDTGVVVRVSAAEQQSRSTRLQVAAQLRRRLWVTSGLVAYAVAAAAGLAGGVLATRG